MVAMSESATRVIAVEERTLKFDLRTNQLLANGGCDRASIRTNAANHPSKRPVREASRKTLSTGREANETRGRSHKEVSVMMMMTHTTWRERK
jgi:hypothetical protein